MNINDDQTWQKIRRIMMVVSMVVLLPTVVISTFSSLHIVRQVLHTEKQDGVALYKECQASAQSAQSYGWSCNSKTTNCDQFCEASYEGVPEKVIRESLIYNCTIGANQRRSVGE